MDDYCTNYHCAGDCGLRGHGTQHQRTITEDNMKNITINHIPCISTIHMPDTEALERLHDSVHMALYDEGAFIYVHSLPPLLPSDAWLKPIAAWATSNVFEWVRLDADGDVVEELPSFEWEHESEFEHAGTLIHGTHRTQDLIPAFVAQIKLMAPDCTHQSYVYTQRPQSAYHSATVIGDRATWWDSADAHDLMHDLQDTLNELAPDGWYFGAHPGDGSDFGYWMHEE